MFKFGKKSASPADIEKDVKKFNLASTVSVAAHKVAIASAGTCGVAAGVVVGNCYYAPKRHMPRKERKQAEKINSVAAGVAIASASISGAATIVEAIAMPLPFDQSKYIFDENGEEDAGQNAQ